MSRTSRPVAAACLLAGLAFTSVAGADLPPPDGVKFVGYAFSVSNVDAFPGFVVVAYPWSLSGGAPTTEHAVVRDGREVAVGRRSPSPKLFAVKKTDWEAFTATYKPTAAFQDPPLEAFFKGDEVIACDAEPKLQTTLPVSDPRDKVVEAFRAEAIGAGKCHLVAASVPPATPASPKPPTEAGSGDPVAVDPAVGGPPPEAAGGCAGCATGTGSERPVGVAALAMAAFALAAAVARHRR